MTEPKPKDVCAIMIDWLDSHGYDGLSDGDECGCSFRDGDELAPCGSFPAWCSPGHITLCDCGEGCDFHIS